MPQKFGLSFTVFWLVISAAFALILFQHIRDIGFKYPIIKYTDRLNDGNSENSKPATRSQTRLGPLLITEEVFTDGTKHSSVLINGTPLDNPTKFSVDSVNAHIDMLSSKKDEENTTAIVLDVIGLVSSLFSAFIAFYEWKKIRSAATV